MSMHLGYLVGTAIFAAVFLIAVFAQIKADRFHPLLYWTTIVATTTVGTTLADFADRSLGIGYTGGASLLFCLLMASLAIWYRITGLCFSGYGEFSESRNVLLDNDHVFPDLGYRTGRLDGQHGGTGIQWRGNRLQRPSGSRGRTLLLDKNIQNSAFLGRVHPYATPWSCGGRFSRQAT